MFRTRIRHGGRDHRRHRQLHRFPAIVFVLTVMLVVFGSLPDPGYAQDGEDPTTETPEAEAPADETPEIVTPEPDDGTGDDGATEEDVTPEDVDAQDSSLVPGADEPRDLAIVTGLCPPGFDGDQNELAANCQGDAGAVTFNVSTGGYNQSTTTSGGQVSFSGIPATNNLRVEPSGYEDTWSWDAYCLGRDSLGTTIHTSAFQIEEQGAVWLYNIDVALTFCTWYFIPDGDVAPAADVGTIIVNKHFCEAGYQYDTSAPDMFAFAQDCQDPAMAVAFIVTDPGGYDGGEKTTPGTNPNTVDWDDVPITTVTVQEARPAGYQTPIVAFCDLEDSLGNDIEGATWRPSGSSGDRFEVTLQAAENVSFCDVYNIPAGDPSDITVYKWFCPSDYDWHESGADPLNDCTETRDGVNFMLNAEDDTVTDLQTMTGDSIPGAVRFGGTEPGEYTLVETKPDDVESAFAFCVITFPNGDVDETTFPLQDLGGSDDSYSLPLPVPSGVTIECHWFNITTGDGNTVTVYKWLCPDGSTYDHEYQWYAGHCTQSSDEFAFELTTTMGTSSTTPNTGQYQWTDVPMGLASIQEALPAEYGQPVVWCGYSSQDGSYDQDYERYDAPTGYVEHEIPEASGYNFYCQWFNMPGGPGEVTIYKWTCPEGYDLYADGADPKTDCADATNGITYFAEGPDGYSSQTDTGDSVDGAVYFGGLEPGDYTFTEKVPADTRYVFVLDCTGLRTGSVHPYPLSMGDTLEVSVHSDDVIVCHWYNVPAYQEGKVTVSKYWCSTDSFESTAYCEIYEDGVSFDLLGRNGSDWKVVDTQTTDGAGKIMWFGVDEGEYWLDEHDQTWCAIQTTAFNGDKDAFMVESGKETVVKVYNCSLNPPGGKQPPTKYPNTGVGQTGTGGNGGNGAPADLPAFMGLGSMLALALVSLRNRLTRFRVTGTGLSRGLVATLFLAPMNALSTGAWAQDGDDRAEGDSTPTSPVAHCLPADAATPTAEATGESDANATSNDADSADGEIVTPTPDPQDTDGGRNTDDEEADADADTCLRGSLPVHITIDSIGVDAGVEYLETVEGEMQAPNTPDEAAWYKETARLGETGNMVLAGHLNYWNVPEGVFFAIDTLRPGDEIVMTGEDGADYTFEVQAVGQEDAGQPPSAEALGDTGVPTLTLITCGGEWNIEASEYDHRTVVRAALVPGQGAGDEGDEEGNWSSS